MKQILDAVLSMVERKRDKNLGRPDGEKYAEMQRIRLGTRLPAYLPQRITKEFVAILKTFKAKGIKLGIKQFVIQTHIQSAMEVTPELKQAVEILLSAGWLVTNQVVFTSASSRRGHTAKLRKVLNEIGVVPYYTFSVKGFMENYHNFATNARLVQEMQEEKSYGKIPEHCLNDIVKLPEMPENSKQRMKEIKKKNDLLFLSTDRSVMNLPGVGKSMTFRVIGITDDGHRVLEFEYDHNRKHSPYVNTIGKVEIVESKSISKYLEQMEDMGEKKSSYRSIWGYSVNVTEEVMPIYKYPGYNYSLTEKCTNIAK
jgi:lysine 2,3-aminomutase